MEKLLTLCGYTVYQAQCVATFMWALLAVGAFSAVTSLMDNAEEDYDGED